MLSILIPVYNFDIRDLVAELHQQCEDCEIEFEILCFDDGSQEDFLEMNRVVGQMKNAVWKEMPQNYGRSKIRNVLGKAAIFPYLIFMDCDSKVRTKNYIKSYLGNLDPDFLQYGGRIYKNEPPPEREHLFHWRFGKNREESTSKERTKTPHHSFMTNNFLIPKKIFMEIQFDERLTQYGHEDTIFGLELKNRQIPIFHLDNPLEHLGLEETEVFLDKTRKGIQNLYFLFRENDLIETKLLNYFKRLKKWKLVRMGSLFFQLFENQLIRNFKSKNPNLRYFDLYKLAYLCKVAMSSDLPASTPKQ